jgi:hypothetical protein
MGDPTKRQNGHFCEVEALPGFRHCMSTQVVSLVAVRGLRGRVDLLMLCARCRKAFPDGVHDDLEVMTSLPVPRTAVFPRFGQPGRRAALRACLDPLVLAELESQP